MNIEKEIILMNTIYIFSGDVRMKSKPDKTNDGRRKPALSESDVKLLDSKLFLACRRNTMLLNCYCDNNMLPQHIKNRILLDF